jgi:RNA polymerase sigma factor (sigma-70 family)
MDLFYKIGKETKILTQNETNALLLEYQETGDEKIVHHLFNSNMRYMILTAKKFVKPNEDYRDVIGVIYEAFKKSCAKYDFGKNAGLLTYFRIWVKDYMTKYRNDDVLIYIPLQSKERYKTYTEEIVEYNLEHNTETPIRTMVKKEEKQNLKEFTERLLDGLTATEKKIIKYSYKINTNKNLNSKEIAQLLKLDIKTYFIIKKNAKSILAENVRKYGLRDFNM